MEATIQMPIGVNHNGDTLREVTFLETNGVAEKIFTTRSPEKPYTWMAQVLTIAIGSIGSHDIASKAREEYRRTRGFTIPEVIKNIPFSEVNTLLVEVHRKCWEDIIPNQESICKYCNSKMHNLTIDLNRIEFDEADLLKLDEITDRDNWYEFSLDLPVGYKFEALGKGKDKMYEEFAGKTFNRMKFRTPTLGDAIKNEKYANDNIGFWRRLAADSLLEIIEVDPEGSELSELPPQAKAQLGIKLFNDILSGRDLKAIRNALQEYYPTLPFYYEEECPSCQRQTPVTIEAGSFFSA